ncbi:MAG TPA: class B sortase [Feifaniaceae bacterium]|nr:class B sortase [Feifaniaceae bacterium]
MTHKKRDPKTMLLNVFILLCAAAMLVCGALFALPFFEYRAGDAAYTELSRSAAALPQPTAAEVPQKSPYPAPSVPIQPDYEALLLANGDFCAWLYCEGTVINYPVVQGGDNRYYLSHLFNGQRNKMGTLFVDASNAPGFSDQNTIIYGHHMKNGSMFASLVGYKKQAYYDEHPELLLLTPSAAYRAELFAGYIIQGYATNDVYKKSFDTEAQFLSFLGAARTNSDFVSDVEVTAEDRIITFSTCTYEYDDSRYVVLGKLVRIE